jgi:hypothetical protein
MIQNLRIAACVGGVLLSACGASATIARPGNNSLGPAGSNAGRNIDAAGLARDPNVAPALADVGSSAVVAAARVLTKRFSKGLNSSVIFANAGAGAGRGGQPAGPPPPLSGA